MILDILEKCLNNALHFNLFDFSQLKDYDI